MSGQNRRREQTIRPKESCGLNVLGEESTSMLECPVCYEICVPPIFTCVNGHSFCNVCKRKLKRRCPECRGSIRNGRCFALERIYSFSLFPCLYKEHGCTECVRGDKFEAHVKTCVFKFFLCPMKDSPSTSINTTTALSHFEEAHRLKKASPTGAYVTHNEFLRKGADILLVNWKYDGKDFVERLTIDRWGFIRISIILIGNKSQSKLYTAELQLVQKGRNGRPNTQKALLASPELEIQPIREVSEATSVDSSLLITDEWFEFNFWSCLFENCEMEWISRLDVLKRVTLDVNEPAQSSSPLVDNTMENLINASSLFKFSP